LAAAVAMHAALQENYAHRSAEIRVGVRIGRLGTAVSDKAVCCGSDNVVGGHEHEHEQKYRWGVGVCNSKLARHLCVGARWRGQT
jgi:hypothetical protein